MLTRGAIVKDANDAGMKKLSTIDPTVVWDDNLKKWSLPAGLQNKLVQGVVPKNYQKKMEMANYLGTQKLTQEQIIQFIPPIVTNIIKANDNLSKYGIGPKSKNRSVQTLPQLFLLEFYKQHMEA